MLRPKVLVVDGDRHYSKQLVYALEEDYEIFDAEDRESALKHLKEKMPDIVLTDLYLPPKPSYTDEGFTLLRQFKAVAPHIKIIIVTAEERREIIAKCQELGADDYVAKPFEVHDLKNAINRLISFTSEGTERRRYRRVECEIPICYSLQEDKPSITGKSKTVNISPTGLLFLANESTSPHSLVGLELFLQKSPTIKAIGEVRWATKVDETHNIGLRFVRIKEGDRKRIVEYIYA